MSDVNRGKRQEKKQMKKISRKTELNPYQNDGKE